MGQIVEVRQLIQAASGQAPAAPNSTSTAAPAATPQPVIINLDFMGQRVMESLVGHLVKNKFHPLGG